MISAAPYCSGITPETVAAGGLLRDAIAELVAYAETELIGKGRSFCLVTHGSWDLPLQLRREANDKGIALPEWMLKYVDLRTAYTTWKVRIILLFPISCPQPHPPAQRNPTIAVHECSSDHA